MSKLTEVSNWFTDLFSESSDVSMTRFLSFVCVATATVIGIGGAAKGSDVTAICSVFLGFGLGAKVSQRFIESKEPASPEAPK